MPSKAMLMLLKLSTALASCCIYGGGDVLAGPLWSFVLLGLISKYWFAILQSAAFIVMICLYVESAFNHSGKWDLCLLIVSGAAFDFFILRFQGLKDVTDYFIVTFGVFNALWLATTFSVFRFNNSD